MVWLWTSILACSSSPGGTAVQAYVEHLHRGEDAAAYAMVTAGVRGTLPLADWKGAMHTDRLADVQGVSVRGVRSLSPGGTCVYTDLDFATRNDAGPYGYYIFYLKDEGGELRVHDVRTYDRIEGGVVKRTYFDEAAEPFPCHSNGL